MGDLDISCITAKVHERHREGRLKELTVPEIKCYLKAHKIPVGGKKEELMARLAFHLKI